MILRRDQELNRVTTQIIVRLELCSTKSAHRVIQPSDKSWHQSSSTKDRGPVEWTLRGRPAAERLIQNGSDESGR